MNQRTPIRYMGFWDVPRIFIARHRGETILFDCAFDEALDDYPDAYKVFLLPPVQDGELLKDWTTLQARARSYLGEVPIDHVQFDSSKRQSIDAAILDELLARKAAG